MENDGKTTRRRLLKLTSAGLAGATLTGPAHARSEERDENVVFVHPKGEGADVAGAARANRGRVVYDYENFDFVAVRIPSNSRRALARDERVGYVEDDGIAHATHHKQSHEGGHGKEKEAEAPSVATLDATDVEAESATLNGELTALGSADSIDVAFDARSVGTDGWTVVGEQTLDATGVFDQPVSLVEDTEYEFRAVATSSDGSDAGDVTSFTTSVDYSGHPEQAASWGHDRVFGDSDAAKDDTYAIATGDGVDVAILDSGIQHDHLDVADNVAGGVNFTDDGADWTDDQSGHGTHCAGISAAVDNDIGTCGVAPGTNLWAVKVLHGGSGYWSDIIAGIDWCISNGVEILSMSFGGSAEVRSLSDAIETADDRGHLLVSSAGNDGNDGDGSCAEANVGFPAFHEDVVAVAAMSRDGTLASYSSVGTSVDVLAPGTNINAPVTDNDYTEKSGTSMACPHVTGVAALGWATLGAAKPDAADRDRLYAALESEAETVLGTCEEGHGLVRADRVVAALAE